MGTYNDFPEVNNDYDPQGVLYSDGLRSGTFQLTGLNNVGMGIQVGNTQVYSIKPINAEELVSTTFSLPATKAYYIPLTGLDYVVNNEYLELDVPRQIKISSEQTFSVIMSGYDEYEQLVVNSGVSDENDEFLGIQALKKVTSILVYNIDLPVGETINYTLSTTNNFGLPYTDNNQPVRLITCAYKDSPMLKIGSNQTPVVDAFLTDVVWRFTYTNGSLYTSTTNTTTRPVLVMDSDVVIDGEGILTVQQTVDYYGFELQIAAPFSVNQPKYFPVNDPTKVIGDAPNNIGWKGWQG